MEYKIDDLVILNKDVVDRIIDINIKIGFFPQQSKTLLEVAKNHIAMRVRGITEDYLHTVYKGVTLTLHCTEVQEYDKPIRRF